MTARIVRRSYDDPLMHPQRLYIGGRWVPPWGVCRDLTVVDPSTGAPAGTAPAAGVSDLDRAVHAAGQALDHWSRLPVADRAAALARLADAVDQEADALASLIVTEMGSPCAFTRGPQLTHPAAIARSFATLPDPLAGTTGPGYYTVHDPVGVVAAVTPWNMPLKTIMMKLAPALLAGCTVVVKPAPQTPVTGLALADLCDRVGIPPGVVNVTPAHNAEADSLISHRAVHKVAFTGSTATGRHIGETCGRAFRRLTAECGGKSAAVLGPDGDLDAFTSALYPLSLANNGQVCSNLTRLIVPTDRAGEVAQAVADQLASLTVGDPCDPDTDIGPLVTWQQRDRAERYIDTARQEGARIVHGGRRPRRYGWFMSPHLLTGAPPQATINQDEVFAPVLTMLTYRPDRGGEDEAVQLANDTSYGLAAGVWSHDDDWRRRVAARLRAGTVHLNGTVPDVSAPIGGVGDSGIGRELGRDGLQPYLETKVIAT